MVKKTMFSKRELELIENLKTVDITASADKMKISPRTARSMLVRIRDKIELARDTSNYAANWLDSGKHPRLGKLLRREE